VDSRVRRAVDLLKAHPDRRFTIPELARAVNLSHWHFTHLFLRETNISPTQFSRQMKFDTARNLLETSFLSVKEIMAAVGINDKSHFTKDFKKIYGLSPSEYRRRSAMKYFVKKAAS
jgi:AraC family transcriptional regulator, arabinose operon regulatory protein